jgi:hypothetical protein
MHRFPKPSPALAVATVALFVALGGTALAASPVVKRALFADNAGKLQGKSAAALVAQAAAAPGPASTVAPLISVKSQPFSLNPTQENDYTTACDAGKKAIAGGVDEANGTVVPFDTRPSVDGGSWRMYLANFSNSNAANGTLYAICIG